MNQEFNASNYVSRLERVRNEAEMVAVFADIAALPSDQKEAAGAKVEEAALELFKEAFESPVFKQINAVLSALEEKKDEPQVKIAMASITAQLEAQIPVEDMMFFSKQFLQVLQLRGESAHPTIKMFAEEAGKLSDEEYNSGLGQVKLLTSVYTKANAAQVPANPFRKPGM